jgi:hypothetical protein
MNGNEYLVNRQVLNSAMSEKQLSDNSIALRLAPILCCNPKAAAVRIGGIRRGETIAVDAVFLGELEKVLNIKSGSLFGEATTKAELQRKKRLREKDKDQAMQKIKLLISKDNRKKTVEVDKDFLEELLILL